MGPLSLTPVATTNIWRVQSVSLRPLPQPAAPSLRHRPRSMCFQTSSPAHQFTELAPPASASPPSVSAASQHHLRIVCPIAENPLRPRPGLYTWPSALLLGLACTSSRTSCLARPLNRCNCARHGVAIAFSFRVACHGFPAAAHIPPNRAVLPGCRTTYGRLAVHAVWFSNALRSALTDALSQRPNLRSAHLSFAPLSEHCDPGPPPEEEAPAYLLALHVRTSLGMLYPYWSHRTRIAIGR